LRRAACLWGQKAFAAYLGADDASWAAHDACELLKTRRYPGTILVDQGGADAFLNEQLRTELLIERCREVGQPAQITVHDGYDHSYFFVASFIETHLRHHARALLSLKEPS
jgi:S-formylglutathione hydrolase